MQLMYKKPRLILIRVGLLGLMVIQADSTSIPETILVTTSVLLCLIFFQLKKNSQADQCYYSQFDS